MKSECTLGVLRLVLSVKMHHDTLFSRRGSKRIGVFAALSTDQTQRLGLLEKGRLVLLRV